MSEHRNIQVSEMIAQVAAEFVERESNRQSLITITRAEISPDFKKATIFFTVFPESEEAHVLEFMKRDRPDFREYFKKHARMKTLPRFDFEIDSGEKNRLHIDTLSNKM